MAWRGTGLPGVLAPELLQPDDYDPADHQGQSFVETLALDAETIERGGFAITVGHLVKHRHQVRVRLRQIELEKGMWPEGLHFSHFLEEYVRKGRITLDVSKMHKFPSNFLFVCRTA